MLSEETVIAWDRRQKKASGCAAAHCSQGHYVELYYITIAAILECCHAVGL